MARCFSMGHSLGDGCKLAWSTLGFHLANGLKLGQRGPDSTVRKYVVRYAGRLMDLHLRRQGGDMFIFHEVFCSDAYRPPRQIGSNVQTVVDLGANIGLTTLYFQQYFPNASYLCVEPNPANAAVLRRNVAWMGARARVVEAAVSDYTGYAIFDGDAPSYGGHLTSNGAGTAVRCEMLASLLEECGVDRVDLLKIDIEGAEKALFRSSGAWLPKVRSIVIELHDYVSDPYEPDQYRADIEAQGFTLLPKTEFCPMLWAYRSR